MSFKTWWQTKGSKSKTITVLATLLILEIGLCFSTPFTVAPAYEALFGPTHDSELGLGLEIWQFFLWLFTLAILVAVFMVLPSDLNSGNSDEEKEDE
jgi:branched-subunit amino acid permease